MTAEPLVYLKGKMIPASQAGLSIFDAGVVLGATVTEMTRTQPAAGAARSLERELWEYFVERREHVPQLRDPGLQGLPRVSLLNLAEHLLRLWGPPTKLRKPAGQR